MSAIQASELKKGSPQLIDLNYVTTKSLKELAYKTSPHLTSYALQLRQKQSLLVGFNKLV